MSQPAANCLPLQHDTAIPHDIQGTDTAVFNIYTCDDILILTAAAARVLFTWIGMMGCN